MMKQMILAGLAVVGLMFGMAGVVGAVTDLPILSPGWNLVGLMVTADQPAMDVAELGDVTSVWKWAMVNGNKTWAVYLPGEGSQGDYAASKGFGELYVIEPGEGFWVNVPNSPVTTTTTTTSTTTTTTLLSKETVMWEDREWQKDGSQATMNWDAANAYCAAATTGGYDDWFLPSIETLKSLIVCSNGTQVTGGYDLGEVVTHPYYCGDGNSASYTTPTIDPAFTSFASGYWSSTTNAGNSGYAWYVSFDYGVVNGSNDKSKYRNVHCVRGGQ